jgi:glycosyltransferase involved in cell wall biosynthesis
VSRSDDANVGDDFDVVIVTPTYISSNPRVVKEADALAGAGLRVCVVFSQGPMEWARDDDEMVAAGRPWRAHAASWSRSLPAERGRYLRSTLRFHLARRLPFSTRGPLSLVVRAECRTFSELARAAAAISGRLYIGHYPEGLAAAAYAAQRWNARTAYDVEDLHTEEDAPTRRGRQRSRRVFHIERHHIGRCAYVSAVSEGVAQALADRYKGITPLVIHNVFPWKDRDTIDGQIKDRRGRAVSLYWYSQVIGLDRGLQDVIRALGQVRAPFQLHVRGFHSDDTARHLRSLAAASGVADRLFVHGRVPPTELLSRTAEHDIGLALEQPVSRSRELSVTNKLFFYLLAGLAVVATATRGQQAVLRQMPGVGDVYPPDDHVALAGILNRLLSDPSLLAARRQAALAAACSRWNWETEQAPLIQAVHRALNPNVRAAEPMEQSSQTTAHLPAGGSRWMAEERGTAR